MDKLRSSGLRITAARLAVLSAISEKGQHRDAETIAVAAREKLGSLSTQAVYDNLNALAEAGLVRRIQPSGRAALYETRVGDNHHHLICRICGNAEDVDCAVGKMPCLEPVTNHGYMIDEAEVIYWGVCPHCQSG